METPDFFELELPVTGPPESVGEAPLPAPRGGGLWGAGERITWVAGLILMLSGFMDWYAGSGGGVKGNRERYDGGANPVRSVHADSSRIPAWRGQKAAVF